MDSAVTWQTVALVLVTTLVSGIVALAVALLTSRGEERRMRASIDAESTRDWQQYRMEAYALVIRHAHGYWSSFDDDGGERPGAHPDEHYESFKLSYATASLICARDETDDALGHLEDALGHWRLAERGVESGSREHLEVLGNGIEKAISVFQVAARTELGIESGDRTNHDRRSESVSR